MCGSIKQIDPARSRSEISASLESETKKKIFKAPRRVVEQKAPRRVVEQKAPRRVLKQKALQGPPRPSKRNKKLSTHIRKDFPSNVAALFLLFLALFVGQLDETYIRG